MKAKLASVTCTARKLHKNNIMSNFLLDLSQFNI